MKKTTSLIVALLFSAVMLVGEAVNTTAIASESASLCCNALSGCGSDECCSGRGSANGCIMQCDSGTGIICPKGGGGGGEELLQ